MIRGGINGTGNMRRRTISILSGGAAEGLRPEFDDGSAVMVLISRAGLRRR